MKFKDFVAFYMKEIDSRFRKLLHINAFVIAIRCKSVAEFIFTKKVKSPVITKSCNACVTLAMLQ